jgi:hypothetical protein
VRGKREDEERGLCVRVRPPHTIERRGEGEVVSKEVARRRGARKDEWK